METKNDYCHHHSLSVQEGDLLNYDKKKISINAHAVINLSLHLPFASIDMSESLSLLFYFYFD